MAMPRDKVTMAKRHLAGMVRSSPNVVKFDSEPEELKTQLIAPRMCSSWTPVQKSFLSRCRKVWAPKLLTIHSVKAAPRAVQQRRGAQTLPGLPGDGEDEFMKLMTTYDHLRLPPGLARCDGNVPERFHDENEQSLGMPFGCFPQSGVEVPFLESHHQHALKQAQQPSLAGVGNEILQDVRC